MSTLTRVICLVLFGGLAVWTIAGIDLDGQTATGSIVGEVHDESGAAVAGAQVTLMNVANNQASTTVTNNLGYYSFPLVQPAAYKLSVRAQGFKEWVQENIHLNVATTLSINVALSVGQVTQSVTVTDEPSLLDTQTSSLGQVMGTSR